MGEKGRTALFRVPPARPLEWLDFRQLVYTLILASAEEISGIKGLLSSASEWMSDIGNDLQISMRVSTIARPRKTAMTNGG